MQQRPQFGNVVQHLLAPAEADVDQDAKTIGFKGVAYSGAPVSQNYGAMAIDLGSLTHKQRVPITRNHEDGELVGWAEVRNDGRQLTIEKGHFLSSTTYGKEVAATMQEGQPWEFSVGVFGALVPSDRKRPVQLNGRTISVDAVMRNARLNHISFVPAGADLNAIAAMLSARYGQPTDGATSMPDDQNAELQAANEKIRQLEATNAQLKADAEAAAKREKDSRDAARKARVDAVFEGAELSAEDRDAYMGMTDAQFAAVEKREGLLRKQSDPALFQRQANGGRDPDAGGAAALSALKPIQGLPPDEIRAQLHARATKYAADNKVDYLTAVQAVEQGA